MHEEAFHLQFSVKNVVDILARVDYSKLLVIAVQLGLETAAISEIEAESVPEQRRIRLANTWIRRNPGANWKVLSSALCHQTVGENVLASELEDRYTRRGSTTSSISDTSSSPGPLSPLSPTTVSAVRDLRTKARGRCTREHN